MVKSREHVTTNGRAVFFAAMWEDFRNAASDCGWALGLHGSLNSDMDIMAMPWTAEAVTPQELTSQIAASIAMRFGAFGTLLSRL